MDFCAVLHMSGEGLISSEMRHCQLVYLMVNCRKYIVGRGFVEKALKVKNLVLVFLVTALDLCFGPFLLVLLSRGGYSAYAVTDFEQYPGKVLMQTAMLSVYSLGLLLVFGCILKRNFGKAMALEIRTYHQLRSVFLLGILLLAAAAVGIKRTGKPLVILYGLLYFVFAVGFQEEFLIRGVCVHLLKDFPWQIQYLLPNFLFAMLHIFAYGGFEPITLEIFKEFVSTQLWTLMASGCCLQLLKERSGCLWVPIMIHGLMDFYITFL